jgi:hypothetical protein
MNSMKSSQSGEGLMWWRFRETKTACGNLEKLHISVKLSKFPQLFSSFSCLTFETLNLLSITLTAVSTNNHYALSNRPHSPSPNFLVPQPSIGKVPPEQQNNWLKTRFSAFEASSSPATLTLKHSLKASTNRIVFMSRDAKCGGFSHRIRFCCRTERLKV